MSVRFEDTGAGDPGLAASEVTASDLDPTLPFSVSLWVRIEADTGANFQTIWWHGEAGTDNYVSLRYQKSTGKVQLVAGASYPASVSVLTSTATISFEAWHLVTIVVSRSGSTWTHAMFVDDQTAPTPVTGSGPTSGNPGFDRFVLGQTGASPVQPLDGYAEQVAVWSNHAVTEAEHDRMFAETSDNGFLGLRRAPDAITEPNLAWWMLTGHHRHGLRVDDSQTTVNLGELRNEATTANQPDMQMLDDEIRPTWSVISPLVYYAPVTPGTIPPRPAKRAIHRRSPRFLFFQKPELFEPWKTNEGKHPIYDDPNCAILCRTAYTSVNVPARNPPAFITALYVPQTYITNVARRVADWMQYQGYASDNMLVRADDDPEPAAVYVQNLGEQQDNPNKPNYGLLGLNTDEKYPPSTGPSGLGEGIPLQQHPLDRLRGVESRGSETPVPRDWFVNLYRQSGTDLLRAWADGFWPSLKAELDRRSIRHPARFLWDYEHAPRPPIFCQGHEPTSGDGNWFFHECRSGSTSGCTGGDVEPRWTGETLAYEADGTTTLSLSDLPITSPDVSQPISAVDNEGFRADIYAWESPLRQEALYHSLQTPGQAEFPDALWGNYWDLSADREGLPMYLRAADRKFNTPANVTLRTQFSIPVLYPPPGQNGVPGFQELTGGSPQGAFIAYVTTLIDACAGAKRPLALAPYVPGVKSQVAYTQGGNTIVAYEVSRADMRAVLLTAWQRGAGEFGVYVPAGGAGDNPDFGHGRFGGVLGEDNGDNPPSEPADYDATYEECRMLRDFIEFCGSARHDRICRTMRHGRRV